MQLWRQGPGGLEIVLSVTGLAFIASRGQAHHRVPGSTEESLAFAQAPYTHSVAPSRALNSNAGLGLISYFRIMNHSTPGLPVITNSQSPPKPMCIESVLNSIEKENIF